jgi:hypothetical protein
VCLCLCLCLFLCLLQGVRVSAMMCMCLRARACACVCLFLSARVWLSYLHALNARTRAGCAVLSPLSRLTPKAQRPQPILDPIRAPTVPGGTAPCAQLGGTCADAVGAVRVRARLCVDADAVELLCRLCDGTGAAVRACVRVHVRELQRVHECTCTCLRACVRVCVSIWLSECVYARACARARVWCACVCLRASVRASASACMRVCMHGRA